MTCRMASIDLLIDWLNEWMNERTNELINLRLIMVRWWKHLRLLIETVHFHHFQPFSTIFLPLKLPTAFFSQAFATQLERETVPPAWQAAKASSSSRPQTAEGYATAVNHVLFWQGSLMARWWLAWKPAL